MELFNTANFGLQTNRLEAAKRMYWAAINKDSTFCDAWDNLSICYRKLGDYKRAFNASLYSLTIDSVNAAAWSNCGYAAFLDNDIYRALMSFTHLQRIIPDDPEGYYGKAFILYAIDSISEAKKNILTANKIYKTPPSEAILLQGFIEYKNGDLPKAQSLFERVYSKYRKNAELNYYLGKCYMKNEKNQKKANKFEQKAIAFGYKPH